MIDEKWLLRGNKIYYPNKDNELPTINKNHFLKKTSISNLKRK